MYVRLCLSSMENPPDVEQVRKRLAETDPGAPEKYQLKVAQSMCGIIESGTIETEIDPDTTELDYLISRLSVRDGDDDPSLRTKWNYWLGQMSYFSEEDYERYKVE